MIECNTCHQPCGSYGFDENNKPKCMFCYSNDKEFAVIPTHFPKELLDFWEKVSKKKTNLCDFV